MNLSSAQNHEKRPLSQKLPVLIIALLACIYIVNCFTPLRLTNDTIRYINIKEWIEAGKPSDDPVGKDFLPYGYVWFLLLWSKLHLAKSFFISVTHLLYLSGSLLFVRKIFGSTIKLWQLIALCMLNWATMKFVITPLSEMQFLFFSTGALYFFLQFQKKKKPVYLPGILLFTAAAMLTRTVGFLLVISFIITLVIEQRNAIKNSFIVNKWISIGIVAILALPFFYLDKLGIKGYMDSHSFYFRTLWDNPLLFVANNLKFHLIDWAALFLNSPAPKINILAVPALRDAIYFIAGIVTFAWMLYLLFSRKGNTPLLIIVYIVCYIGVILNWPLFEPRLWVPVIPLFIAVTLQQPKGKGILSRYVLPGYMVVYILVGLTALSYYTYTSLNKKALSIKQDAGVWKKEYETYFFGKPLSDTTTVVKEPIVRILKKYN